MRRTRRPFCNPELMEQFKAMKRRELHRQGKPIPATLLPSESAAIDVLKIKAKLGELMPSEQGKRTDKLPGADTGSLCFDSHTISAYRKLAANVDQQRILFTTSTERN